MLIKVLAENTAVSEDFKGEHGLSLYIETKKQKIIFDFGASNLCIEHASKLGIDLADVDLAVISHGHHDHGGGLKKFLAINAKAPIYVRRQAFDGHYSRKADGKEQYIGLEHDLLPNDRFIFTGEYLCINEELELFSGVKGEKMVPTGNQNLLMKKKGERIQDDFSHEQNLLIKEGEHKVLIAGCAHKGIINIIEHVEKMGYGPITHVIGGFHLYSPPTEKYEEPELVNSIGNYLKSTGIMYYTCHCTGTEAYKLLKEVMQEKIAYLACPMALNI
ncbi:MAG: MBL fold metallo-hydrolase [Firmicutes bacterium]|nr:MBL fold metallo-hydrolase [Bacillota bacterium]